MGQEGFGDDNITKLYYHPYPTKIDFRATITIDLPIQEEPVLESLCEKTNIEMGPVVFGVSNSERRSLLENISNTEEGAEILKSRKTLSNYISDVKGVGSQLGIGLSKLSGRFLIEYILARTVLRHH